MPSRRTSQLLDQFWRAQARIGLDVRSQALNAWSSINPLAIPETGRVWLALVLSLVRAGRARSRRNAILFYRLYRAYETGYTFPSPDLGGLDLVDDIPLGRLREEWAADIQEPFIPAPDDNDPVRVEPFEWPEDDDARLDRVATVSLAATGPGRVHTITSDAFEEGEGRLDDPDFLAELESAGRNAANHADNEAVRAGRDLVDRASARDRRVIGWARITDGNPCHFCAMLASRGAVYRSRATAEVARSDQRPDDPAELSRYHPGCHCQVVPIYTREAFLTGESRRLNDEWKRVTRGKSGAEARQAWRRHIEAQQRERRRENDERLNRLAREA